MDQPSSPPCSSEPKSTAAMSIFRFLDLPNELQDCIFAAYAEDVHFGYDLASITVRNVLGNHKRFVRMWFLSLGDARTHGEMPALLLTSKSIHKRFIVHLGTHKHLCLPRSTAFYSKPAEFAKSVKAQIPYWLGQSLREISIAPHRILHTLGDSKLMFYFDESTNQFTPKPLFPLPNPVKSFGSVFPRLEVIHVSATDVVNSRNSPHIKLPSSVEYGDPDACKTMVGIIVCRKLDQLDRNWSRGLREDVIASLDVIIYLEHKGFCCDKLGRTEWVSEFLHRFQGFVTNYAAH